MKSKHIFLLCLVLILTFVLAVVTSVKPEIGECESYFCDVKVFTLKTNIDIKKGTENIANVHGNLIRFLRDPLSMYDNDGTKIAYGDDEYHFITQDSHMIYVNGQPTIEMVGKFNIFGDSYDIYDTNGQIIATAKFNMLNSYGSIVGTDESLWADYHSNFFRLDYDVRITDKCKIDETSVLMMMASFFSDRTADSSSHSKSD